MLDDAVKMTREVMEDGSFGLLTALMSFDAGEVSDHGLVVGPGFHSL